MTTPVAYDYQLNFFANKDGLASGDPLKLITGQQFEAEFSVIDPAIKSCIQNQGGTYTGGLSGDSLTLTGTFTVPQIDGGTF
jgi:hypothetical protein